MFFDLSGSGLVEGWARLWLTMLLYMDRPLRCTLLLLWSLLFVFGLLLDRFLLGVNFAAVPFCLLTQGEWFDLLLFLFVLDLFTDRDLGFDFTIISSLRLFSSSSKTESRIWCSKF